MAAASLGHRPARSALVTPAPTAGPPLEVLLLTGDADRAALLALLAAVEPTACAVAPAEAFDLGLAQEDWDLILVRHRPTHLDARAFTAWLARRGLGPAVVVITDHPDDALALATVRAGALDCLAASDPQRLHLALTRELRNARRRRERAQREQELARREARFRSLVETTRDLVTIYRADGVIEYQSPSSYPVLGYRPEELMGLTAKDFVHPEDHREIVNTESKMWRRMLAGATFDLRVRHADGHWAVLEAVGRPLPEDESRFVINCRDVTARRAADLSHARLAEAVEQAAEAIVLTDLRGIVQYVNPAFERISGYSRAEVVGETPRLWSSGQHDRAFYQDLWDTLRRGEVWTGIFVNRRKDGAIYREQATISPVRDEVGSIANHVAVKTDITAQVALEQRLGQAQKMEAVGRLAGGVAHDFNNLLMLLLNHAEFINLALPSDSPIREDVQGILAAGTRAAELTRQLLTFSRHDPAQAERIDLNQAIRSVGKLVGHAAGEGIELVHCLAAALPEVSVDPGQMEQVLMNLVLNARDAMPDGGRLTIATELVELDAVEAGQTRLAPGRYVRLTIADTGIGMSPEVLDRVFEPYYTTKPRGKGTGLGLSTVYGSVTGCGGEIQVVSRPGQGSTFTILLPPVSPTAAPDPMTPPDPRRLAGDETILVVEDEDAVRTVTRRILERRGYRVFDACCGADALDFARDFREPIDLLLTDMVMPRMSGRELAGVFRQDHPSTAVLYMSGYAGDVLDGLGDLGGALLQKPFGAEQLLGTVRALLDESGAG